MRRLFWLAMGVTIGVLVVRRLSRAAASARAWPSRFFLAAVRTP